MTGPTSRLEAREKLDLRASILNRNPSLRLRLSGHTDERGSDEYNLALGVPAARLDITSFGDEDPVCQERIESCWSQYRRVEFEIIGSGDLVGVR